MSAIIELKAVIDDRPVIVIKGRFAHCLYTLSRAGEAGVSPATDDSMPRWSHYVFWLRKRCGVGIETMTEKHGGPYAGTHARYVLRSKVTILEVVRHGGKRNAA
jgi:hypothetical protein